MKLTSEDKELLLCWGYKEEDFLQIEAAMRKSITKYEIADKKIKREEAIEMLGREEYLSGIARSAFHWSAARVTSNGEVIHFNSSRLFK